MNRPADCAALADLQATFNEHVLACRLDEIIVFRQLTKGEVKQIADIMLAEVFHRAQEKDIKIDVTERFKVSFCLAVYLS